MEKTEYEDLNTVTQMLYIWPCFGKTVWITLSICMGSKEVDYAAGMGSEVSLTF